MKDFDDETLQRIVNDLSKELIVKKSHLDVMDAAVLRSKGLPELAIRALIINPKHQQQQQLLQHDQNRKRRWDAEGEDVNEALRAIQTLLLSKQFDEAWNHFKVISKTFVKDYPEEPDDKKCNPVKISSMWEGEEGPHHLSKLLGHQCGKIESNIQKIAYREIEAGNANAKKDADDRTGRVVGIRLGSGCGKTHLLLEAPRLLSKQGIYITYTLEQSLRIDVQQPRRAVLLRILLRLDEIPHAVCPLLLERFAEGLLSINTHTLREFVAHQLSKAAGETDVFVGVDEIMALETQGTMGTIGTVREVVSELGVLATDYYKTKKNSCYVFVTSLKDNAFYTSTGRSVIIWTPERPDEHAAEQILKQYRCGRPLKDLKQLLVASAGFHFRSMVFAAQVIGEFSTPSVQTIVGKVYDRWKERVSDAKIVSIRDYVMSSCRGVSAPAGVGEAVEEFLDHTRAVPPALICGAFGVMTKQESDDGHMVDVNAPLYKLFNCELAYTDDAKQLEQFGESYDLFRAKEELPILSEKVKIHVVSTGTEKLVKWFRGLQYPSGLSVCADSLFETVGRTKIIQLAQAGLSPSKNCYYSPSKSNHPFVDRAYVAKHMDGGECFVLIQDKVNDDVPTAVEGLNKAGALLKTEHPTAEILCILNVIGAGDRTTSQHALNFSYVLVGESDLPNFYTAHFAPVARFIRQRHVIGQQQRQKESQ